MINRTVWYYFGPVRCDDMAKLDARYSVLDAPIGATGTVLGPPRI